MTNKEILKLAKKVGFSFDEDDGTWFCFEEELVKFALAIHEDGYNKGYNEGWESSDVSTEMNRMEIEE